MKKNFFTIVLFLLALTTKAQTIPEGSYADKLTYFINAGASNFDELYDGVIPINVVYDESKFVTILSGVMDSSYSYLVSVNQYSPDVAMSQFRINYCESSNYFKGVKLDKIRKEVPNYFESLAQSPEYKITKGKPYLWYKKNIYLFKNGILLASYHDKRNGMSGYAPNIEGDFCIIFYEQPRTKIIADETTYAGVFPNSINATSEPQIWESKTIKDGKEQIQRWNGIFTSAGILKAGTKTFEGFGSYLDGVWYSDNWEYGKVKFIPKGTNDIVCGLFNNNKFDLNEFDLRDNYWVKFKDVYIPGQPQKYTFTTNYNCDWVKNIFSPFKINRDAAQRIIQDKRNAEIEISNEKYRKEHPEVKKEIKKTGIFTTCKYCNGTGKVVDRVVTGSQYETTHYRSCSKCGGAGAWMQY